MSLSFVRLRHWKQRFTPGAAFVFRQASSWEGQVYNPGDVIPVSLANNVRRLRTMWDARRIQLQHFPELDIATGKPPLDPTSPEAVANAIAKLDRNNAALWTKGGELPRVDILSGMLGVDLDGDQRDAGQALYLKRQE